MPELDPEECHERQQLPNVIGPFLSLSRARRRRGRTLHGKDYLWFRSCVWSVRAAHDATLGTGRRRNVDVGTRVRASARAGVPCGRPFPEVPSAVGVVVSRPRGLVKKEGALS